MHVLTLLLCLLSLGAAAPPPEQLCRRLENKMLMSNVVGLYQLYRMFPDDYTQIIDWHSTTRRGWRMPATYCQSLVKGIFESVRCTRAQTASYKSLSPRWMWDRKNELAPPAQDARRVGQNCTIGRMRLAGSRPHSNTFHSSPSCSVNGVDNEVRLAVCEPSCRQTIVLRVFSSS